MVSSIGPQLYNMSSYIQSNATLNRALMEVFGIEVPFTIMGNNKDERIERAIRANLFVLASFIAPVVSMPLINKIFLKKEGLDLKKDKHLLQVSKEYLAEEGKLKDGFENTAKDFVEQFKRTKKPIHKEIADYLEDAKKLFPDMKGLRNRLAKTHKNIFLTDFLIASLCAISIPWVSNFITEKRTNRVGYVGEFKIAGKDYTDKMAEKHESGKKTKIAISFALPILVGLGLSNKLHNAMMHSEDKLGKFGKYLKKNINAFDYKNAIYMSRMGYMAVMVAGDLPAYMLACRDKHELKMRTTAWTFMLAMLFGGDYALNNIVGRFCDWKKGTKLMDDKGFENASFIKRFRMDVNGLDKLNKMSTELIGEAMLEKTKKYAHRMYWGNLALTAALLGFGLSAITNAHMRKDVKNDLEKLNQQKDLNKSQFKFNKSFTEWKNSIRNKA